jgi:hypothetical protein
MHEMEVGLKRGQVNREWYVIEWNSAKLATDITQDTESDLFAGYGIGYLYLIIKI